jgi:hypothetical protein
MGRHSNRNESLDGYRFNLVNGQVSGLQEYDDGRWKTSASTATHRGASMAPT